MLFKGRKCIHICGPINAVLSSFPMKYCCLQALGYQCQWKYKINLSITTLWLAMSRCLIKSLIAIECWLQLKDVVLGQYFYPSLITVCLFFMVFFSLLGICLIEFSLFLLQTQRFLFVFLSNRTESVTQFQMQLLVLQLFLNVCLSIWMNFFQYFIAFYYLKKKKIEWKRKFFFLLLLSRCCHEHRSSKRDGCLFISYSFVVMLGIFVVY